MEMCSEAKIYKNKPELRKGNVKTDSLFISGSKQTAANSVWLATDLNMIISREHVTAEMLISHEESKMLEAPAVRV